MKTEINNELIRSFKSCYDPSEVGIPDNETLTIKEWVEKYSDTVKNKEDITWLLCRNDFMSDRDLRLFAVWCARESFKLQDSIDERSINACNVSERFANGEATQEELSAAESAAWSAWSAWSAAWSARSAARYAAESAAWSARSARSAARYAAESAAWSARYAAESAAWSARSARSAARYAAWSARSAQIDKLLTYFQ